jgi:hypothetical protein
MSKTVSSSTQRLLGYTPGLAAKETLNDASSHFPSYLRLFGNFFQLHAAELHWGTAQLLYVCCVRFFMAQASVAFV